MENINLANGLGKMAASSAPSVVATNVVKAELAVDSLKNDQDMLSGDVLPEKVELKEEPVTQKGVIEETVSDLNTYVQNIQRGIQFSVHESTGKSIVTVTDVETGDVIRRFPSEDMLNIAEHLAETLALPDDARRGLLIEESA